MRFQRCISTCCYQPHFTIMLPSSQVFLSGFLTSNAVAALALLHVRKQFQVQFLAQFNSFCPLPCPQTLPYVLLLLFQPKPKLPIVSTLIDTGIFKYCYLILFVLCLPSTHIRSTCLNFLEFSRSCACNIIKNVQ